MNKNAIRSSIHVHLDPSDLRSLLEKTEFKLSISQWLKYPVIALAFFRNFASTWFLIYNKLIMF